MTSARLRELCQPLVVAVFAALCCVMRASPAGAAPFAYIPNGRSFLSIIDTATNVLTATIPVGQDPRGVAVRPDGRRVYVSNFDDGTVSVIDASTHTIVSTVPVLPFPRWIAAAPDGSVVYIAHVTQPGT
jgi:YVTN family beta-propeller protein